MNHVSLAISTVLENLTSRFACYAREISASIVVYIIKKRFIGCDVFRAVNHTMFSILIIIIDCYNITSDIDTQLQFYITNFYHVLLNPQKIIIIKENKKSTLLSIRYSTPFLKLVAERRIIFFDYLPECHRAQMLSTLTLMELSFLLYASVSRGQ